MNFVRFRSRFYLLSLILIIPGVLALIFWGLRFGIDFVGGAEAVLGWQNSSTAISQIQHDVEATNVPNLHVQQSGDRQLLLRYEAKNQDEAKSRLDTLKLALSKDADGVTEVSFSLVGPTVSSNTQARAVKAVVVASVFIVLYIAYAFRGVRKPASAWQFGLAAIVALLHDLLVTAGLFSIIGHFLLWVEVDSLFVIAMLTVLGFSVHDTIVVFDRIRENLRLSGGKQSLSEVVDLSLTQTLARSVNTSLTVFLTLLALFLLGAPSMRSFILALLIGVSSGTYSSIFNASMLLVSWQNLKRRRT